MYTKKQHTPEYATKKKYASCVCVSQYLIVISTVYRNIESVKDMLRCVSCFCIADSESE